MHAQQRRLLIQGINRLVQNVIDRSLCISTCIESCRHVVGLFKSYMQKEKEIVIIMEKDCTIYK